MTIRGGSLHSVACAAMLALITLAGGCSVGKGGITGQVNLDGKPLAGAEVQIEGDPNSNLPGFAGKTDEAGKFVIHAQSVTIKPGKYRALVSKFVDKKGNVPPEEEIEQLKAAGLLKNLVPSKYNAPAESELIVDLKEGHNELQPFNLKSK